MRLGWVGLEWVLGRCGLQGIRQRGSQQGDCTTLWHAAQLTTMRFMAGRSAMGPTGKRRCTRPSCTNLDAREGGAGRRGRQGSARGGEGGQIEALLLAGIQAPMPEPAATEELTCRARQHA